MFSYLFFYPFYCSLWWSDVFKNCYVEKRKQLLFCWTNCKQISVLLSVYISCVCMSTKILFDKCKYNAQIPTCSQHKTALDGTRETVETKVSDYSRSESLNIDTLCAHTADRPNM